MLFNTAFSSSLHIKYLEKWTFFYIHTAKNLKGWKKKLSGSESCAAI
jgi:hypothetical protein